jgi:aminoglycoside/choline kinase family phosphotransferase
MADIINVYAALRVYDIIGVGERENARDGKQRGESKTPRFYRDRFFAAAFVVRMFTRSQI